MCDGCFGTGRDLDLDFKPCVGGQQHWAWGLSGGDPLGLLTLPSSPSWLVSTHCLPASFQFLIQLLCALRSFTGHGGQDAVPASGHQRKRPWEPNSPPVPRGQLYLLSSREPPFTGQGLISTHPLPGPPPAGEMGEHQCLLPGSAQSGGQRPRINE